MIGVMGERSKNVCERKFI